MNKGSKSWLRKNHLGRDRNDAMSSVPLRRMSSGSQSEDGDELARLSPRSDHSIRDFAYRDHASTRSETSDNEEHLAFSGMDRRSSYTSSKGKGKAVAFAYQDDPKFPTRPYNHRESARGPALWKPPLPGPHDRFDSVRLDDDAATSTEGSFRTAPESLVASIFQPKRPSKRQPEDFRQHIDRDFPELFQRRERQLQKELQKLLDAQGDALERSLHPERGASGDHTSRSDQHSSQGPYSSSQQGHVVPVRQPRKRTISLREARQGIANAMAELGEIKNEESSYISEQIDMRTSHLTELEDSTTKLASIQGCIRNIEEDESSSLQTQLKDLGDKYDKISQNIEKLQRQLEVSRRAKATIKKRIEEATSQLDSDLSGYKGALKEHEQSLQGTMTRPGVKALDMQLFSGKNEGEDEDKTTPVQSLGIQFYSLRPERRTPGMAREWWETELTFLSKHSISVDRDRTALEEGLRIWDKAMTAISSYESQLAQSMAGEDMSATTRPGGLAKSAMSAPSNHEDMLQTLYEHMQSVIEELESIHRFCESEGWNLLVVAIGAELEAFYEGKQVLLGMFHSSGITVPDSPPRGNSSGLLKPQGPDDTSFATSHTGGTQSPSRRGLQQEELSGSVIRRWEEADDTSSMVQEQGSDENEENPNDRSLGTEESDDNAVPTEFLTQVSSRDDDNEIPPEFLSTHLDQDQDQSHEDEEQEDGPPLPWNESSTTGGGAVPPGGGNGKGLESADPEGKKRDHHDHEGVD